MPEARITDILLEVDDATRFTEVLAMIKRRAASAGLPPSRLRDAIAGKRRLLSCSCPLRALSSAAQP